MTSDIERLVNSIQALPEDEQRRLLERVSVDLAQKGAEQLGAKPLDIKPTLIGLLSDEPELAESITGTSRTAIANGSQIQALSY